MKKVLALILAAAMAVIPMTSFAGETETDYSYLEDMSVKELKALRDAINEILGDGGGSSGDIAETGYPSVDENGFEISVEEVHYCMAIESVRNLRTLLKVPSSLKPASINYSYNPDADDDEVHTIYISYTAENVLGGSGDDVYITDFNKLYEPKTEYNASQITDSFATLLWGKGECPLNVDFIMNNLEADVVTTLKEIGLAEKETETIEGDVYDVWGKHFSVSKAEYGIKVKDEDKDVVLKLNDPSPLMEIFMTLGTYEPTDEEAIIQALQDSGYAVTNGALGSKKIETSDEQILYLADAPVFRIEYYNYNNPNNTKEYIQVQYNTEKNKVSGYTMDNYNF